MSEESRTLNSSSMQLFPKSNKILDSECLNKVQQLPSFLQQATPPVIPLTKPAPSGTGPSLMPKKDICFDRKPS